MVKEFLDLIKTNDKCIGCNKCIRSCVCTGALVAEETEEGKNFVKVDATKCIGCGACFDACVQGAREFVDDTDSFINDLEKGEKITLLVAPSFFSNYPEQYGSILGGLREMGVTNVINVGFGADITMWASIKYMLENNFIGGITQPCPTVVNFIEKYSPDLIPMLFPVQSPMMCAAIYARKEMNVTEKIAFLGPCISKKDEQMSARGKGLISYNVTFANLMKYVRKHNIKGKCAKDEILYGMGSIFPISGGLKENVLFYLGDELLVRHIEGEKSLYTQMLSTSEVLLDRDHPYLLIDVLNCKQGCCYGTAVEVEESKIDRRHINLELLKLKIKNSEAMENASKLTPEQRLSQLNGRFDKFNIEDYLCTYTDRSAQTSFLVPSESEFTCIYEDMGKLTVASTEIDCGCCGFDTCEAMAIAIHNGFSYKANCIHYIRDEIEKERDKARKSEIYYELAIRDIQTGLYNRNAYYEWCEQTNDFSNCAIITYDLNNLKQCNDTLGHAYGDIYISESVNIIRKFFDDFGVSYRVGGDEFITIIQNTNEAIVERQVDGIKKYLLQNKIVDFNIKTGIAIGYAVYSEEDNLDFAETEKRADMSMYENKIEIKGLSKD